MPLVGCHISFIPWFGCGNKFAGLMAHLAEKKSGIVYSGVGRNTPRQLNLSAVASAGRRSLHFNVFIPGFCQWRKKLYGDR